MFFNLCCHFERNCYISIQSGENFNCFYAGRQFSKKKTLLTWSEFSESYFENNFKTDDCKTRLHINEAYWQFYVNCDLRTVILRVFHTGLLK